MSHKQTLKIKYLCVSLVQRNTSLENKTYVKKKKKKYKKKYKENNE